MNLYFSFAGNLTYRNARNLHDTVRVLPLERILIESEAPFMVPADFRGKRNKPEYLPSTAAFLAELVEGDPEEVSRVVFENACRLFRQPIPVQAPAPTPSPPPVPTPTPS
jgi:TatD DNase family protein